MAIELRSTADGSHTLYVPELNEHYHSSHGAIQEAKHVFIDAGLKYINQAPIRLLEIGFGTGLNALLSAEYAEKNQQLIHYVGLEKYPVSENLIGNLNYTSILQTDGLAKQFIDIHQAKWAIESSINPWFKLTKLQTDLHTHPDLGSFDLIYFDAFGYRAQEDMWTQEVFIYLYGLMVEGGVLVTYSSKGEVRRRMTAAGFTVQKLPGPVGKREMVRAFKPKL